MIDLKDIQDPTPREEYARLAAERRKQEEERLQDDLQRGAQLHSQQMHAASQKGAQLDRIEAKLNEVLELLRR